MQHPPDLAQARHAAHLLREERDLDDRHVFVPRAQPLEVLLLLFALP